MAKLRFVHAADAAPIQEGFTGVSSFLFPLFPRERGDSLIILKVLRSLWAESNPQREADEIHLRGVHPIN